MRGYRVILVVAPDDGDFKEEATFSTSSAFPRLRCWAFCALRFSRASSLCSLMRMLLFCGLISSLSKAAAAVFERVFLAGLSSRFSRSGSVSELAYVELDETVSTEGDR